MPLKTFFRPDTKALQARIHELEEEVRELRDDLIHDSLTRLKTRRFFEEETHIYFDAVAKTHSEERRTWFGLKDISFILFDVDHFKSINDTYGHLVGDEVLKLVAQTIELNLRKGDIACRWGGEEMIVSLIGANAEKAADKAEQIRQSVEKLEFKNIPGLKVTVSAGVAATEPGATYDEVLKRADEALYKAKEGGRNRVITNVELSSQ